VVHGSVAHATPSGRGVSTQPSDGEHAAATHGDGSGHANVAPARHVPLWHVSSPLQTFPSPHGVPSAAGVSMHPRTGSQLPTWHGRDAAHVGGAPPVHAPATQCSVPLHASPSSQSAPSGSAEITHSPAGPQLVTWHASGATHVVVPDTQLPLRQTSLPLHTSPSSHDVPSAAGPVTPHQPAVQVPTRHASPASHTPPSVPGVIAQRPPTHESAVHVLRSSHADVPALHDVPTAREAPPTHVVSWPPLTSASAQKGHCPAVSVTVSEYVVPVVIPTRVHADGAPVVGGASHGAIAR
jgi:hypothetical protein